MPNMRKSSPKTNYKDPTKPVVENLTYNDVEFAIKKLHNDMIDQNYIPDIVVSIDRGGAIVGGMLSKALSKTLTGISAAEKWTISSTTDSLDLAVRNMMNERFELPLNNILVVDDASRSGFTSDIAFRCLEDIKKQTSSTVEFKFAVILNQIGLLGPAAHKRQPDFWVFETEMGNIAMPWDHVILE